MVLPQEIGDAAQNGDRDRVIAWLNAGGSINDPVLHFLARLGDNGVVWHVLSFWRATN